MLKLNDCRACGGLVPAKRTRCPHCGTLTVVPSKMGGLAAAIGLGTSSLVGCGPAEPPPDAGVDAGQIPVADYGIAVFPDSGPTDVDAGTLPTEDAGVSTEADAGDAGQIAVADYGIVSLPDGGH